MSCNCKTPASCSACASGASGSAKLPACNPYRAQVCQPYHTSLAADMQSVVDGVRLLSHEFGMRPHHCFLIWQERDAKQVFREIKRIELLPVRVRLTSEFTRIQWNLGPGGAHPEGFIQLEDISPNQVSESDLRGQLDGHDPPDGVEFFYEVTQDSRCAGEANKVWRYALQSVPFFIPEKFMYVVDLADQAVPRGAGGIDQVLTPRQRPTGREIRF